jgi:hypothetical protein
VRDATDEPVTSAKKTRGSVQIAIGYCATYRARRDGLTVNRYGFDNMDAEVVLLAEPSQEDDVTLATTTKAVVVAYE